RPRTSASTMRSDSVPVRVPGPLVRRLKDVGREERATLFVVLLAAFAFVLRRWSGQTDVMVGTAVSTRRRPELASMMGFFVNTVFVRANLSEVQSGRALIDAVRQACAGALENADLPFERVVQELNPTRALVDRPILPVMFSMLPVEPTADVSGELS